ncbi:MAG: hypothetical protein V4584_07315 [Verrucomicrobiota bacterium]
MTLEPLSLVRGPAEDVILVSGMQELFATAEIQPLRLSPETLQPSETAIILDASYWWFDIGRQPEVLRIEQNDGRLTLIGSKRFEAIPGESSQLLGDCSFGHWTEVIGTLQKMTETPNTSWDTTGDKPAI